MSLEKNTVENKSKTALLWTAVQPKSKTALVALRGINFQMATKK
jgi:hypothetical protein